MQKIVLTILLALSLEAKMVGGVAVVVKGDAITILDIEKEMQLSKVDAIVATAALIRKKLELQEVDERKISVDSSEVYEDIKKSAARNGLNVNEFYEAIRESNGLTSAELKEKIKEKLLSQKLYSSIAYSAVEEPSDEEIKSYYSLHKESFVHPSGFNVVIYTAQNKQRLQEKVDNPMFHSPDIESSEQNLPYDRIAPELAQLLASTPLNSFTPVVPNGKGAYVSFYVKEIEPPKEVDIESVRNQIMNMMMAEQREEVLGNYFARLRHNADIKMVRNVE